MDISESAAQALTKLIELGVEKSADKLATMSKTKWTMQAVSVHPGSCDRLKTHFDDDLERHYGSYFSMPDGAMLALIPESSGHKIVTSYLGDDVKKLKSVPKMEEYVLGEITNVLVNTIAAELANTCGIGFLLSAPKMSSGSKNHLYSKLMKKFPAAGDDLAVTSYVRMSSASLSASCSVSMLLDEELTANLLSHLDGAP